MSRSLSSRCRPTKPANASAASLRPQSDLSSVTRSGREPLQVVRLIAADDLELVRVRNLHQTVADRACGPLRIDQRRQRCRARRRHRARLQSSWRALGRPSRRRPATRPRRPPPRRRPACARGATSILGGRPASQRPAPRADPSDAPSSASSNRISGSSVRRRIRTGSAVTRSAGSNGSSSWKLWSRSDAVGRAAGSGCRQRAISSSRAARSTSSVAGGTHGASRSRKRRRRAVDEVQHRRAERVDVRRRADADRRARDPPGWRSASRPRWFASGTPRRG